jgi:hypothetical protein
MCSVNSLYVALLLSFRKKSEVFLSWELKNQVWKCFFIFSLFKTFSVNIKQLWQVCMSTVELILFCKCLTHLIHLIFFYILCSVTRTCKKMWVPTLFLCVGTAQRSEISQVKSCCTVAYCYYVIHFKMFLDEGLLQSLYLYIIII